MSDSDTLDTVNASTGYLLAGGKRQRSRQVCTECRQKKIKCDAQDTFPAPCSRCVATQPTPLCRVDPNYRRSRKRPVKATDAPSSTDQRTSISASLSTPPLHDIELIFPSVSRPLVPLVPLAQTSGLGKMISDEQLAQSIWPSVFELGGVHVSIEQATVLFDEFFKHFHPSCPIFLAPRAPVPTHRTDPLLFWAILAVAFRGPPLPSDMQRILEGVSYMALAEQVKASVAALGIYPPRTLGVIQALLLLCEWPLPANSSRDDRTWHYSSLAIQTALQIGLHRPQFPHEFSWRIEQQVIAESVQGQERTLAWIYCHIIGYSIASIHGVPSLIKDDYVTLSASNCTSANPPPWLSQIPRPAISALRIARLTDRIACTLGNSISTPSGQLSAESTAPMFSVFNTELGELDRGLGGGSEAQTTLRLHLCRIRLCAFMLQSVGEDKATGTSQRALAATDCYVSCMRLIDAACATPREEVARWPISISFGHSVACICLIRLLSSPDGAALDMNAALTQVSALFRVASDLRLSEGLDSLRERFNQLVSFSMRDVQLRRADKAAPDGDGIHRDADCLPGVQSRMGLANWLKDSFVRAQQARKRHEADYPGRGAEIISCASDLPAHAQGTSESLPSASASVISDLPLIDYTMFTTSDFDDILASFSRGEWSMPAGADCAEWMDNETFTPSIA